MKRLLPLLLLAAATLPVEAARTLYVSDRLEVTLHAEADGGKAVRTLRAGDPLEPLERRNDAVRVRAPGGEEGWLAERLVSDEPPAAQRLMALEAERGELRGQLREARGKLAAAGVEGVANPIPKLEEALDRARAENRELRARLVGGEQAVAGVLLGDWRAWAPWAGGLFLAGFLVGFIYYRVRRCENRGGIRVIIE